MLDKALAKRADDAAVHAYLHETLGIAPKVRAWAGTGKLPYFLQEAFEVRELKLLDRHILLAIEQRADRPRLANVRGQMDKLRQLAGMPVVYVTRTLASYERKRLIEQKVPFLVPGNQLYLPELGIDLREYFRKPTVAAQTALSPATQAMLIAVLLRRPWRTEWQPAEVVGELGYTPMTLSRAVKELTAAGIATLRTEGGCDRSIRSARPRRPGSTRDRCCAARSSVGSGCFPSEVEAASAEARGSERAGAIFDAH